MERTRQYANSATWLGASVLLLAVLSTGCGAPMYHFKHYQRPFAAFAKSNKTYFQSGQTGRIIEKDPCRGYCEPDCFGYEPTCWTTWPAECPGNCPQGGQILSNGTVISGMPEEAMVTEGVIIHEGPMQDEVPVDADSDPVPQPETAEQGAMLIDPVPAILPETRVPSIPTDLESAQPSPSDGTHARPKETRLLPFHRDLRNSISSDRIVADHGTPQAEPVLEIPQSRAASPKLSNPFHTSIVKSESRQPTFTRTPKDHGSQTVPAPLPVAEPKRETASPKIVETQPKEQQPEVVIEKVTRPDSSPERFVVDEPSSSRHRTAAPKISKSQPKVAKSKSDSNPRELAPVKVIPPKKTSVEIVQTSPVADPQPVASAPKLATERAREQQNESDAPGLVVLPEPTVAAKAPPRKAVSLPVTPMFLPQPLAAVTERASLAPAISNEKTVTLPGAPAIKLDPGMKSKDRLELAKSNKLETLVIKTDDFGSGMTSRSKPSKRRALRISQNDETTLRFASDQKRKSVRLNALAEDPSSVRFR